MINTRRVTNQSHVLADEWYRKGRLQDNTEYQRYLQNQKGFRRKKKSDETRAREASERRYTRRSNICTECNQTKSVGTGTCGCDE